MPKSTNTYLKNIFSIAKGAAFAQIISFAASPIITRLYSPEAMGLLGLFVNFVTLSSLVQTLRYDIAVVAADNDKDAILLTRTCIILSVLISILSTLLFDFFRVHRILGYSEFPYWITWIVFIGLALSSSSIFMRYYMLRCRNYSIIGKFNAFQAAGGIIAKILLSFNGLFGLIVGDIFGRIIGLITIWGNIFTRKEIFFSSKILIKYKIYPLVHLPSGFINTLSASALVPIIVNEYSLKTAGYFLLAQRVVNIPLSIISEAVGDVFYGEAAKIIKTNADQLIVFFFKTIAQLALCAIIFSACIVFFGSSLVVYIFGANWGISGQMILAMIPWTAMALIVSPVSRLIFLSRVSWLKFIYDILSLSIVVAASFLNVQNPLDVLKFISISQAFLYVIYFFILLYILLNKKLLTFNSST